MSNNAENLNELLNGLLDGVLTDDEQRRVDLAMREDPSLEDKLNELSAMRSSLLRGRSVGRLGPDFAGGVIAAARQRASQMGSDAPEWIADRTGRDSNERQVREKPSPSDATVLLRRAEAVDEFPYVKRAWSVWLPVLSLAAAASTLLFLASNGWMTPRTTEPLVRDFRPASELESGLTASNEAAMKLLQADETATQPRLPEAPEPESAQAENLIASDADAAGTNPAGTNSAEAEVDPASAPSMEPERSQLASNDAITKPPSSVAMPPAIAELLSSRGVEDPVFTLVADITIDPVAEQNEALPALLDKYEILYADDLNLNESQLETLLASQMVGPLSKSRQEGDDQGVSVLFLRARATRIDAFLTAIESQYRDFPGYRLELAFDPSVLQLTGQLSKIVTNVDSARRLTFTASDELGLVTAFPAGKQSGEYLKIEERMRAAERQPTLAPAPQDSISYLILLVRTLPE